MNRKVLANRLGVEPATIAAWEKGEALPPTPYIIKLAKLFEVSCDYLLCRETPSSLCIEGLSEDSISMISDLIHVLRRK